MTAGVDTPPPPARDSRLRRFRIAVVAVSLVVAIVGSALLVMRDSAARTTALGVTATRRLPGHPGAVVAGPGALWVALVRDSQEPAGDARLLRLDLATQAVTRSVHLDGEVSDLERVGGRLIASVRHVGSGGQLAVLGWRSGAVLDRHWYEGPVDQIVVRGNELWALGVRPRDATADRPGDALPGLRPRFDSLPAAYRHWPPVVATSG